MKKVLLFTAVLSVLTGAVMANEGTHKDPASAESTGMLTVKGEIVDLVCYIDHNATGAKHADCAKTCIDGGLPVGLKADNGTTYLLVGEHKSVNKQLAPLAGKTVTLKGKAATRDGIHLLENVEVVQ